jgi:hypothetical protein
VVICGAWKKVIQGSAYARRTLIYRCDQSDGHPGPHEDNVLYTHWSDEDCDPECRVRNMLNEPFNESSGLAGDEVMELACRAYNGAVLDAMWRVDREAMEAAVEAILAHVLRTMQDLQRRNVN